MAHNDINAEQAVIEQLRPLITGEVHTDSATIITYATDASVYREMPLGVVIPKTTEDIIAIVRFARKHHLNLIPRAGGTSLAGQVVGRGLVVEIAHHFNKILEINTQQQYAVIQPGIVRDELNLQLQPYGYFFAPETATSNRCCVGGMCGNNSCGANSLLYGSTRGHILTLKAILSDGSQVEFADLSRDALAIKCTQNDLEGNIYRTLQQLLNDPDTQAEINREFPAPELQRRSMGYAVDELIRQQPFESQGNPFNLCTLLVGSEGTLAFITEIKIKLTPLPPEHKALVCVQTDSIEEALQANLIGLEHQPAAIELIDDTILQLAKQNITQNRNRFFLHGDPAALIVIEINEADDTLTNRKAEEIIKHLKEEHIGHYYTIIKGDDMARVWALRKAGLGIMSNAKGDAKPVTVVEDIAIRPCDYADYYREFKALLDRYGLHCAYYAHISTGELHNKPIFNLKDAGEIVKFHDFAHDAALLVKKYRGTLSGEHGDGRLRGQFLSMMVGEKNYALFRQIKRLFDPDGIFNRGKIVDTPPMNSHLRYSDLIGNAAAQQHYDLKTMFDFSDTDGILRAIEKCNGSADCKKSQLIGGTMCPSYKATHDERNATRSRANILRELLTYSHHKNPFNHKEMLEALDLCLACKACKSECPSNVDMTKIRAEFLYQYHKQHPYSIRTLLIAYYPLLNQLASPFAAIYNYFCNNKTLSKLLKKTIGFATERSLPTIHRITLRRWAKKNIKQLKSPVKTVYLFADEFTNTNDVQIGMAAILLLQTLNYQVKVVRHGFSGRTFLSKGMLRKAKKLAERNVQRFAPLISDKTPLLGIEPSAILSFRDEYPELVAPALRNEARQLGRNCLLIDEFIAKEFETGNISRDRFTEEPCEILFHSHCYQKALSSSAPSIQMMQIPIHYHVTEIKSGCCGMAGAFGYEKEHYELSLKVGNLALFPAIREKQPGTVITATGTSCRHQIKDGTGTTAHHPIEILYHALNRTNENN